MLWISLEGPTNTKKKEKSMNHKYDELTKSLAQSVTRRAALKKFGLGLAGIALASFGLANKAEAPKGGCKPGGSFCQHNSQCCSGNCFGLGFGSKAGTCTA
jgi:hypothetical protein